MRSAFLVLGLLSIGVFGCGDDSPAGTGGGGGGTTSVTGGTSGSTTDASSTATTSVGTGGGKTNMAATITDAQLGANCMPVVGSDPVSGTITVDYENVGSLPGELTIGSARLVFATPVRGWVFDLLLDPATSGSVPANSNAIVQHMKVATPWDSSFICQLCGMPGTLSMSWMAGDGDGPTHDFPVQLQCAF